MNVCAEFAVLAQASGSSGTGVRSRSFGPQPRQPWVRQARQPPDRRDGQARACHDARHGAAQRLGCDEPCGARWRAADARRRASRRHGPSRTRGRRAAARQGRVRRRRARRPRASCRSVSRGAAMPAAASDELDEARAVEAEAGLAAPQIGDAETAARRRRRSPARRRRAGRGGARRRSRRRRGAPSRPRSPRPTRPR